MNGNAPEFLIKCLPMRDYRKDFASFEGNIWLNAAGEGPLPLVAAEALKDAVRFKCQPALADRSRFSSVPADLKRSLGRLIGVHDKDVILGNSASYGLHLLANGIPWQVRDEILVMQNDFPTNILPWLGLEQKGVKVIQIPPQEKVLSPQEVGKTITPLTRLLCVSHVHSFTGITLEIEKMAEICRKKKIIFVVNISQSVGAMPVNVAALGADAIVAAGYKWLCGPYGTGFCWMKPELRERLQLNQAYWIAFLSQEELKNEGPLCWKEVTSARKFDVFATANYFNFVPFKTCVDYWLDIGLGTVRTHNQKLVDKLIEGLDPDQYVLISPREGRLRSDLVVISHREKSRNNDIFQQLSRQGITTALWKGNLRVSPHLYNTGEEIDVLLESLRKAQ